MASIYINGFSTDLQPRYKHTHIMAYSSFQIGTFNYKDNTMQVLIVLAGTQGNLW